MIKPTLPKSPESIDIAVIGAGPHALTFVAHLLQKKKSWGDRIQIFDPSGVWLHHWQRQFAALEIPHLRSPAVHHPAANPFALRQFAQDRSQELYAPYDLPGTKLFTDFCDRLVQDWQLQNQVIPTSVEKVEPLDKGFRLWLGNGSPVLAQRVVVANGGGQKFMPDWVNNIATPYPKDRLQHSSQIDLRNLSCRGERILIIGSGLTSGHLAIGAASRGAKVTMMARRVFYEKLFDADPGWLGPKYLKNFHANTCWQSRWQTVVGARNGGSLTPEVLTQLHHLKAEGKVQFIENCEIQQAQWREQSATSCWDLDCHNGEKGEKTGEKTGEKLECDRLWLATGSTLNVQQQTCLKMMQENHPIPIINGLPVLSSHLRWGSCELYLMGGLAALQVGPTARNLSGARMASERIVDTLLKPRTFHPLLLLKL